MCLRFCRVSTGDIRVISLKKYLDSFESTPAPSAPAGELLSATMESLQGTLRLVGAKAAESCPAHGCELQKRLQSIGATLSVETGPEVVRQAQQQVEAELVVWAERTVDHCRHTADEVKQLLLALAGTAESIGATSETCATQFRNLTVDLESIVVLDDLAQVRASLQTNIVALKSNIEQMTRAQQTVVRDLRARVSAYENKLSRMEPLVYRDEVTGIANRRSIEERVRWAMTRAEKFCIVMLDINAFKGINDKYGHAAGDNLLRQFAAELKMSARSGDFVGRWGGDEFIVLLTCVAIGAGTQVERLRQWVFGDYMLDSAVDSLAHSVRIDAAVGLAEWEPGMAFEQLIAKADAAMYQQKRRLR
jgi:diguanylate cyclase (GGDEF)-like protein